jgi:hypothetical protein
MCDIVATHNCGSRNALFGSERIAEMRGQRTATGPMPVTISRLVSVTAYHSFESGSFEHPQWFQLSQPGTFADPLREVLRNGARALPRAASTGPMPLLACRATYG